MTSINFGFFNELEKLAIKVVDRNLPVYKRPISGILGRVSSPETALFTLSSDPLKPGPTKKDKNLAEIIKAYSKDPELKNLKIYLNHQSAVDRAKDIMANKRTSGVRKLLALAFSPMTSFATSIGRSDHYDPAAHSVTLYTNSPAILAHELGHAKDYGRGNLEFKLLTRQLADHLPLKPGTLYSEAKASATAHEKLKKTKSFKHDVKSRGLLGGAFGTYVGGAVGALMARRDAKRGRVRLGGRAKLRQAGYILGGSALGRIVASAAQHLANRRHAAKNAVPKHATHK